MRFVLPIVTFYIEDGVAVLGFANHEINTTEYLLLQRTLEPDQQDQVLGLNELHIQLNGLSRYGGVEDAQLSRDRLFLRLAAAAANEISNGEPIEIFFNTADFDALASHVCLVIGPEHVRILPSG